MLKTLVFVASLAGTFLLYRISGIVPSSVCDVVKITSCPATVHVLFDVLLIAPVIAALSVIGFFLPLKIYNIWLRFIYIWIPLSALFIYFMPGQGMSSPLFGVDQYFVNGAISAALFGFLSLVLFALKVIELIL